MGAVECEHVEGDDLDSLVGTEDLRQSGALDPSVEKVESVARAMKASSVASRWLSRARCCRL